MKQFGKKHTLIEATPLLTPATGIARYIFEISSRLQRDSRFDLDFFYGYTSKKLFPESHIRFAKLFKKKIFKKISRDLFFAKSVLYRKSYDLYWQPNFIPSLPVKASAIITTLHDFSFLNPSFHPTAKIRYYQKNFFKNIYKSDIIITGSQFVKKEIVQKLSVDPSRIKVIYHGVDHKIFNTTQKDIDIKLPKHYILFVGTVEPRKNIKTLIEAYSMLEKNIKREYKLVIAGSSGWQNKETFKMIHSDEHIIYKGRVTDEELSVIYQKASCFVFPSFYEGFGLPPLEAMACGTPVLSSNASCMPEILDDCALYFDPRQPKELADKIQYILKKDNLLVSMAQKGLKRAKSFTWEESAKKHKEIFIDT